MNTLSAETQEETGACYSATSEPKLLYSHPTPESGVGVKVGRHAALTGYFQRGVVAHCLSQVVASNTDVRTFIRFTPPSMDDAQEEERATGKKHALRTGIVPVRFHPLSILVPLHCRGWPPLCFTVESGGLPFGYDQVRGMLHNPGWGVLLAQTGS